MRAKSTQEFAASRHGLEWHRRFAIPSRAAHFTHGVSDPAHAKTQLLTLSPKWLSERMEALTMLLGKANASRAVVGNARVLTLAPFEIERAWDQLVALHGDKTVEMVSAAPSIALRVVHAACA